MRCSNWLRVALLCLLLLLERAFGQGGPTTTLTVTKLRDFRQIDTAAPVPVTNPFTLTATAQAQGYTISSATPVVSFFPRTIAV